MSQSYKRDFKVICSKLSDLAFNVWSQEIKVYPHSGINDFYQQGMGGASMLGHFDV